MPEVINITLWAGRDHLDANALLRVGQVFVGLLHDLDIAISSDTRGTIRWEIATLKKESPAQIGFVGNSRLRAIDHTFEIERHCIRGIILLMEGTQPDRYYSEAALYKAYALSRFCQRRFFEKIEIRTEHDDATISPDLANHIVDLTRETEESEGSVVGSLDSISVHSGNEFRVWEEVTGKAVTCRFPESMFADAKERLGQRVLVFGTIRKNRLGQTGSIVVQGIGSYPTDEELPTIEEISGSIEGTTGGLPLAEYIKLLDEE